MKLIIFDMDQTLVDFLSVHEEATRRLFRGFFNVDARLTEIDFSGRSLTDSFQVLAGLKNIPEEAFREKSHLLLAGYEIGFGESLPRNPKKYILPGVIELLRELSKTGHIVALYTGDSEGIVRRVLRATGLGKYFRFCLYGTEVAARADMVREAINRAKKLGGRNLKDKDVVIIGDSLRDIECGRQFHALTIAVATGFHSAEQLAEAGPDHLLKDLADYNKVLEIINSGV